MRHYINSLIFDKTVWGNVFQEASIQQNFNFGFSTYKSDILIHLSQWQYWWWFWFSLVWVAYYYIILYATTRRVFSFNPVINTSLRGHGKWGDFLVALIPLSWCANILINSNFILRMIEWQNESSLFTLRIQGKQWYWVYKFDATTATSVFAAPKNIGNDKWLVWTPNDVLVSDSYYQAIQVAAHVEFRRDSLVELKKQDLLPKIITENSLMSIKLEDSDTTCIATKPSGYTSKEFFLRRKAKLKSFNRNIPKSNISLGLNLLAKKTTKKTTTLYPNFTSPVSEVVTLNIGLPRLNATKFKNFYKSDYAFKLIPTRAPQEHRILRFITSRTKQFLASRYPKHINWESITRTLGFKGLLPQFPRIKATPDLANLTYSSLYNLCVTTLVPEWILKREKKLGKRALNFIRVLEPKLNTWVIITNYAYLCQPLPNSGFSHYDYLAVDDTYNPMGNVRPETSVGPVRFISTPLNMAVLDSKSVMTDFFFTTKWSVNGETITTKVPHLETFWGFRQKKYKRRREFLFAPKLDYDPITYKVIGEIKINPLSDKKVILPKRVVKDQQFHTLNEDDSFNFLGHNYTRVFKCASETFLTKDLSVEGSEKFLTKQLKEADNLKATPYTYYRAVRFAKQRTDLLSITLARRLLRVNRTLILPAHVNITVVTNSYDVVHSWFIPGLGIKMDCVPGRSTHHTFYIDNVGLYYGQCAEICGRFHHHMPIRVCALPFDQFLVWWFKRGLPRLNRLNEKVKKLNEEGSGRYIRANGLEGVWRNDHKVRFKMPAYKYNW